MKTPGLTVRPLEMINGVTELCQEYFENVRVPKENIVGEVNKGWTIAKSLLGFERLNSGSPRRPQAPLSSLEKVARATGVWDDAEFQSKYVRAYLDLEDLRSLYQRFCDAVGKGEQLGPDVSQTKIWAGETMQRVSELLMETAGGAGAVNALQDFGEDMVQVIAPFYLMFPMMIASGIERHPAQHHRQADPEFAVGELGESPPYSQLSSPRRRGSSIPERQQFTH